MERNHLGTATMRLGAVTSFSSFRSSDLSQSILKFSHLRFFSEKAVCLCRLQRSCAKSINFTVSAPDLRDWRKSTRPWRKHSCRLRETFVIQPPHWLCWLWQKARNQAEHRRLAVQEPTAGHWNSSRRKIRTQQECNQYFPRSAHRAFYDPAALLEIEAKTSGRRGSITKNVPVLWTDHVSTKSALLGVSCDHCLKALSNVGRAPCQDNLWQVAVAVSFFGQCAQNSRG